MPRLKWPWQNCSESTASPGGGAICRCRADRILSFPRKGWQFSWMAAFGTGAHCISKPQEIGLNSGESKSPETARGTGGLTASSAALAGLCCASGSTLCHAATKPPRWDVFGPHSPHRAPRPPRKDEYLRKEHCTPSPCPWSVTSRSTTPLSDRGSLHFEAGDSEDRDRHEISE
jgi:hypothetical protein